MSAKTQPDSLFARYSPEQRDAFNEWLSTQNGKEVYRLFRKFASELRSVRSVGYRRCPMTLIVNRLRWQLLMLPKWRGFKLYSDYAPMLARQLVVDDATFEPFFSFHTDKE